MPVIKDIENLFNELVDDPKSLMKAMETGGDVLSGSRAANFFMNGLCNNSSDWDFYCRCCDSEKTRDECDLYKYLENIGCIWNKEVGSRYSDRVMIVYAGTFRGISIQLIVHHLEDMIDGILGFHSTASQCIVAHDSAFCAYYDLLKDMNAVRWTTKTIRWNNTNNDDAILKYNRRGIRFIKYKEYIEILGGNVSDPRVRRSGDKSSSLLKDNDKCSLDNIVWLECSEGCIMLPS